MEKKSFWEFVDERYPPREKKKFSKAAGDILKDIQDKYRLTNKQMAAKLKTGGYPSRTEASLLKSIGNWKADGLPLKNIPIIAGCLSIPVFDLLPPRLKYDFFIEKYNVNMDDFIDKKEVVDFLEYLSGELRKNEAEFQEKLENFNNEINIITNSFYEESPTQRSYKNMALKQFACCIPILEKWFGVTIPYPDED